MASSAYYPGYSKLTQPSLFSKQGDAPVHSIGAALFAKKEQIHFFEDIGYRHEPFQVHHSLLCLCSPMSFGFVTDANIFVSSSIAHKEKRTQEENAGVMSATTLIGNGKLDSKDPCAGESLGLRVGLASFYRYSCTNKYVDMFKPE